MMCLFDNRQPNKSEQKLQVGYKVFRRGPRSLHAMFHYMDQKLAAGKWLAARGSLGFGVFLTHAGATKWMWNYAGYGDDCLVLRRVEFRDIQSVGEDSEYGRGVIARRIFILKGWQ